MNKFEYRLYLWILILCVISLIVALFIGVVFDSESQNGPIVIPSLTPSRTPIAIEPLTYTESNIIFFAPGHEWTPTSTLPAPLQNPEAVVTVTLPFDPDFCICKTPDFGD